MSLDNVLAIAAAAEGDPNRVIFGLVVSIAMLLFLASIIIELMNRHPLDRACRRRHPGLDRRRHDGP